MYPNGEATVGLVPYRKPKKSESEKKYDRDYYSHKDYLSIIDNFKETCEQHPDLLKQKDKLAGNPHEDVVCDRKNSVSPRAKKGRLGISSYGSRMVRNACHIVQKRYGRKRLGFGTTTLPEHPVYLAIWVSDWAEIVRRFFQEVRRELERQDAPSHIIGVTEIHPKYSDRVGYAVPHLHFVYIAWDGQSRFADDRRKYYISADKMREMWNRVLTNRLKHFLVEGTQIEAIKGRVSTDSIKKSAEGYLGKYMSKGKKDVEKYISESNEVNMSISHWWHSSKELRNAVKGLIKELPIDILTAILQKVSLTNRGVAYYISPINKMVGDVERCMGYVLKLTQSYFCLNKNELVSALDTT